MNVMLQVVVLLTCIVFCTSQAIKRCQCLKTQKTVQFNNVADVKEYGLRPYCNRQEVIAVMKDNTLRCLDPKEKFIQAVVKTIKIRKMRIAMQNTTDPKTLATVAPTSSGGLLAKLMEKRAHNQRQPETPVQIQARATRAAPRTWII